MAAAPATPAPKPQSISFERPFGFVFKDPNWVSRVLLGGLFAMLGIVLVGSFVILGYQRKLFHALVKDPQARLPEFDFGADLSAGAPVFLLQLCYIGIGMVLMCIPCVGWVAYLALLLVMPVATMRYYVTGRLGAAFEVGAIIDFIKAHFNNVVLLFAISYLAGLCASLGMIACGVGVFFTAFWAGLVSTCALADVCRVTQAAAAAAAPAGAPEPPAPAGPSGAPPSSFEPSP